MDRIRSPQSESLGRASQERKPLDPARVNKDAKKLTEKEGLDLDLHEQILFAKQILKDISKLPSTHTYVEQWRPVLDKAADEALQSDESLPINKRLEEYSYHVDHLDIDRRMFKEKARADQFLGHLSKFPNTHTYVKQWRGFLNQKEEKILRTENISSKEECMNEYKEAVNVLRQELLNKQKARADLLMSKMCSSTKISEKAQNLIYIIKMMDDLTQKNYAGTSENQFIDSYTEYVDKLQKTLEKASLTPHVQDIALTSGNQKGKKKIVEEASSSGTSRGVEHTMEKTSTNDSRANKKRFEAILEGIDLRIDFPQTPVDGMKGTAEKINDALGGMEKALKKAEHLSSEHKMSILSQLQHRRGQIRESWNEAIKAYESEGKAKGLLAKRDKVSKAEAHMGQLSRQLEDLNHIKQYLKTGDSLAGSSTLGKEGRENADAHLINKEIRVYGVFDGVGDNIGSDKASKAAAMFIETKYKEAPKILDVNAERELAKNVLIGGNEGIKRMKTKPGYEHMQKMGTTALLAKIRNDGTLLIANVGDCRALLIKRGTEDIKHLTLDNSYINGEMLRYKQRTREELLDRQKLIASSKDFTELSDPECKSLVINRNALGIRSSLGSQIINPDIYDYKLERGDILILASDGTTDNLTDQEIMKEVKDNAWNPERAAVAVTNKAKEVSLKGEKRSKPDDITTLVIMY